MYGHFHLAVQVLNNYHYWMTGNKCTNKRAVAVWLVPFQTNSRKHFKTRNIGFMCKCTVLSEFTLPCLCIIFTQFWMSENAHSIIAFFGWTFLIFMFLETLFTVFTETCLIMFAHLQHFWIYLNYELVLKLSTSWQFFDASSSFSTWIHGMSAFQGWCWFN